MVINELERLPCAADIMGMKMHTSLSVSIFVNRHAEKGVRQGLPIRTFTFCPSSGCIRFLHDLKEC